MGGFGWENPFPCQFGGQPARTRLVYDAIRTAVGEGGSAEDDSGIDGLWRKSRAIGLACSYGLGERAALQFLPNKATDWLEYYEELLGLHPDAEATDDERRVAAAAAFTQELQADAPSLTAQTTATNALASVLEAARAIQSDTTMRGRWFSTSLPFLTDGIYCSSWPNYSTDFVVTILLTETPGTAAYDVAQTALKSMLNTVLPAWVDFRIINSSGFFLDLSPLDATAFGS